MQAITNGVVTEHSLEYGSNVTYSCLAGYELIGPSVRECLADGSWSGNEPYCQGKQRVTTFTNSPITPVIETLDVYLTHLQAYHFSGIHHYRKSSFSFLTSYTVMCPAPTPSDNAVVSPQSDYYSIGSKVQYTCSVGYGGDAERQCQANGTWSGTQPICEGNHPTVIHNAQLCCGLCSFSQAPISYKIKL